MWLLEYFSLSNFAISCNESNNNNQTQCINFDSLFLSLESSYDWQKKLTKELGDVIYGWWKYLN